MNALAREALQELFQEASTNQRFDPKWYAVQLQTLKTLIRDQIVLDRAALIWATHDTAALLAEFGRLMGPADRWDTGFSFDISDSDGSDDDWLAAYQMAINDVELKPPEYPQVDIAEIEGWLEHQPRRVKAGRPVQMAIFA